MKKRTPIILSLLLFSLLLTLLGGIVLSLLLLNQESVVQLSANPQGDATACVRQVSRTTCSQTVSPFGTRKPGALDCATHASLPLLATLSDLTVDETPLVTLQVWQSPTCHASFASIATSTMLMGRYTLTVSIAHQQGWWQREVNRTTLQSSGKPYETLRAWTALLLNLAQDTETVEACVFVTASKQYHLCSHVLLHTTG